MLAGKPLRAGAADQLDHFFFLDDGHAEVVGLAFIGVEHQRRFRSQRAIGEELQSADTDPVIAEIAADAGLQRRIQPALIDLLDNAQVQAAAFAQDLQRDQARWLIKVVDHGEAASERERLRVLHHVGQLIRCRVRNAILHDIHRSLEQDAGGRAIVRAHDLAAFRIGGRVGDAGGGQGGGIGPAGVPALGAEEDWVARRDLVQIGPVGKGAVVPEVLRPALPGNPLAGGALPRPLGNAFDGERFAGRLKDVYRFQGEGLRLPVQVGVREAGQNRLAIQVD